MIVNRWKVAQGELNRCTTALTRLSKPVPQPSVALASNLQRDQRFVVGGRTARDVQFRSKEVQHSMETQENKGPAIPKERDVWEKSIGLAVHSSLLRPSQSARSSRNQKLLHLQ